VDNDISDARICTEQALLYIVAYLVAVKDRNRAVHSNVNIDVKINAALTDAALLGAHHAGRRPRDTTNRAVQIARKLTVDDMVQRIAKNQNSVRDNEDTCGQRRPIIRRRVSRPANQRDGYAQGRGPGSDRIGAMMPSIPFESDAVEVVRQRENSTR